MSDYINGLYSKRDQLLTSIHSRDNLGADASNTARALAAMDSVSTRLRREINAIDDEIEFLTNIMSEVMRSNAGNDINRMGGLELIREQTGMMTVRLIFVIGDYAIPAEYSIHLYQQGRKALSKQIGSTVARTLYQLMNQPTK